MQKRGRSARVGAVLGAAAMGMLVAATPSGAQATLPSCLSTHWVGTWAASPTSAGSGTNLYGLPPYISAAEQSYRMMVTPHRGGSSVRVRLSNRFGLAPTTFGRVTIALRGSGPAVQANALKPVTFGGSGSVTAAPGQDLASDPVSIEFRTGQQLAVSIYVRGGAAAPTEHNGAISTQYLTLPGAGDKTTSPDGTEYAQRAYSWIYLSGIDVQAPANVGTIVALGDSITDGYDATTLGSVPAEAAAIDNYIRWPDALQTRLDAAGRPIVAINQGISGNRLVRDQPNFLGLSAQSRLQKDVIEQPGVRSAIVSMGINDLGLYPPFATTQELIDGFTNIVGRLKAKGIRVVLGTIPPASSAVIDGMANNPLSDVRRREANAWILTQKLSDGVVDFAAALEDPNNPGDIRPEYHSGDFLHPSSLGSQVMAQTVDIAKLAISPCQTQVALKRKALRKGRLRVDLSGETGAVAAVIYKLGNQALGRDSAAPFTQTISKAKLRRAARRTKSRQVRALITLREREPGTMTVQRRLPKARK